MVAIVECERNDRRPRLQSDLERFVIQIGHDVVQRERSVGGHSQRLVRPRRRLGLDPGNGNLLQ